MKKILISLAIIGVVAAIGIGATVAYFTDTETSTGNTFTAGTMNLVLTPNSDYAVSSAPLFTETNMEPGVSTAAKTLYFKNAGSIAGKVKLNVSYTGADATLNAVDVSDNNYARQLLVVSGVTDGIPVEGYWAQHIIANYGGSAAALADMAIYDTGLTGLDQYIPTVYGLMTTTMYFDDGTNPIQWNSNDTHQAAFTLKLSPVADNDYQSDGISVVLTATMAQMGASF